jgi:hypothetical protein
MTTPLNNSSNSSPGAVGALILIPVIIAGAAAIVAIKASGYWNLVTRFCQRLLNYRGRVKHNRKNRSDLSSSQNYPDSFGDLESICMDSEARLKSDKSPVKDTSTRIWHPQRASRLTWSFGQVLPSQNQSHFESSSVQIPLPAVVRPEKSRSQEEDPADQLTPLVIPPKAHRDL